VTRNSHTIKRQVLALTALALLMVPQLFCLAAWSQAAPVVANPPTAQSDAGTVASGASTVQSTDPNSPYPVPAVNTIQETAETDTSNAIQKVNDTLMQAIDTRSAGRLNETYNGMAAWFGDDMISNIFVNIGQLLGRWLSEFIDSWVSSTVQFLSSFLRTFVLNPNIAVNGVQNTPGANGGQTDDISPYVREAAGTMYGIAIDLLLLLFILCIWKFWAEAAWRGGHVLGAVGRLIFTAGLMLGWPTIYAFEIQITNEMIKAIYFTGGDQIAQLDVALTAAVKAGLVGTTGLLANAFAPVIGGVVGGAVGGTVGGIIAFAGLVIYLILGVVLITQIVYILVLKAIQTGLLTAQYMFAPIFLVFFATPDTESVCSGFVRSFVEVSLWTFVWVGLLKIMVIILYSQFNPWGKITMAVGILQIMIQVPTFLARAQISPMSDFISAGLITGGLMKGASALANKAAGAMTQFSKYVTGDMYGARGMPTSKKVGINNTSTGAANPELAKSLKDAGKDVKDGPNAKTGVPPQGMNLANSLKNKGADGQNGLKKDAAENGLGPDADAKKDLNTPGAHKLSKSGQEAMKNALGANGENPDGMPVPVKKMDAEEAKMRNKVAKNQPPTATAGDPTVPTSGNTGDPAQMGGVPAAKTSSRFGKKNDGTGTTPTSGNTGDAANNPELQGLSDLPTDKKTAGKGDKKTTVNPTGKDLKTQNGETAPTAGNTGDEKDAINAAANVAASRFSTSAQRGRIQRGAQANGSTQAADGGKGVTTQEQTTRVPVTGQEESSTNQVVTPEGVPNKGVKNGNDKTTVTPPTGNLTGAEGVPPNPLAGLSDLPSKMAGVTALQGKGQQRNAGSKAIEGAQNGPRMNNGQNVDPTTVRVPVSAQGNDANNLDNLRAGLVATAAGVGLGAGAAAAGAARQLAMPGSVHGVGGGGGAGNGNGGGNDYIANTYSPPPGAPTRGGRPIAVDGATAFDQANYRWVPGRNLLTDIRTAAGPQQGDAADGQSAISLGAKGISSVRYGQGATSEQKALMLMTAGYAGVFAQDPVAFDAARQSAIDAGGDQPKGFAQRIAANWLQYSGGSFKSTAIAKNQFQQTLMEQATLGAESYVNGQQGNAYTSYLRGRYGSMTADQQAWGVHITSDPSSPESGWSTTVGPATTTLVNAGMPITAENRAAASNQYVMRQPQWARGQAVRGVAAYLGAVADQTLGPNAHPLERDAFVGRMQSQLSGETVEACRAIVSEEPAGRGVQLCSNPSYVQSVASLMSSPDTPRKLDAATAYRNLSGVMRGGNPSAVGTQTVDVISGGGGGGFGGGFVGGGTMPPPPAVGPGFTNAVVDAQYRDMTAGGGGGGFSVPGATVYAPSNNILGSTIVRGPNGVGFSNQTVHANVDVMTGGGNNVSLPNIASHLRPDVVQRTEVNLNPNVIGDDNDVHNVDMNLAGAAGRQEMNVVGGGQGGSIVTNDEISVHGEIIASGGNGALPPVGNFVSQQDVVQRTTANVSFGGGNMGGGNGGTYVQQGLAQVYLNPTASGDNQANYLNNQVAAMGSQAAHAYASNFQSAQQVVIEMMRAGFDDSAIQNPHIASVAMQVYQQDPSMMGSAAIAAKVMQPQEVSTQSVQVVQQMVDAGWSPRNITRPDVLTSQMIIQSGAFGGTPGYGYPDPQHVRQVR
jgi:hypothetical protein